MHQIDSPGSLTFDSERPQSLLRQKESFCHVNKKATEVG